MSNKGWPRDIFICSLVSLEDNWHNINDANGDTTPDLNVDDLDYLKTYQFYWLSKVDDDRYIWYSHSVSQPDVIAYLRDGDINNTDHDQSFFFNDSNKKFKTWSLALDDLANHIAFFYSSNIDFNYNLNRLCGICHFRLNCEPFFLNLVRFHLDYMFERDNGCVFGNILDKSFVKDIMLHFEH